MIRSLFEKWLPWWDPCEFGFSPMGVFCGLDLMAGLAGWVAIDGLHVLFCGETVAAIDRTSPVGVAGHSAHAITPFAWFGHQPDQVLFYELVAFGGGGVSAEANPVVCVSADGGGDAIGPAPPPPRDLAASPAENGEIILRWRAAPEFGRPMPASYQIYGDSGTGSIDWETPIGEIDAGRLGAYAWRSAGFAHGTVTQWVVRGISVGGRSDGNSVVVSAVSIAAPAATSQVILATAGEDQ